MDPVVVGVDAGASVTRAVVCGLDGRGWGRGAGGSGNPLAVGVDGAARAARVAVEAALGGLSSEAVMAAVVGLAGGSAVEEPAARAAYVAGLGLTCPVWLCGDPLVAFAAGTAEADGAVLIAGTGAVAAAVRGWRLTAVVDGLGPLLGDRGSGYWLGREALRAAAWAMQRGEPTGRLTGALRARLGTDDFVGNVYRLDRGEIAGLAQVVFAEEADVTAGRLIEEAVAQLCGTLAELGEPGGPVVLGGGLLTNDTPVRAGVMARLGSVTRTGQDGAAGAAWLAAWWSGGLDEDAARRMHARLFAEGA